MRFCRCAAHVGANAVEDDRETQSDLSAYAASDGDAEFDGGSGRGDEGERGRTNGGGRTDRPSESRPTVAELDRSERVELGVDLLAHVEADELSVAEAVDRIETVTTNPTLTREILDAAELRGVIERAEGRILTRRGGTFVRFDSQVVRREGEFTCRRCGAGLSTGHFVRFESGELGPFGSSCIEKVLGRS